MAIANITNNILTDSGVATSSLLTTSAAASTYQTILTNPVTGTGTTNYLPKFTGASTIGNSVIYQGGSNIGIGETNPASYPLQVKGADGQGIQYEDTNAVRTLLGSYSSKAIIGTLTNHAVGFWSNNSEKMILSTSGNLGLGVTPSAWSLAGLTAMQIKNAGFFGYLNNLYASANAYYNAGWKYIANANAAYYSQNEAGAGFHAWYNAPSGTADAAITWTQAMTLFSDGNLLLTNSTITNAGYKLDVNGTGRFSGDLRTTGGNVGVYNSNVQVQFFDTANSNYQYSLQNYSGNFRLYNNTTSTTVLNFASTGAATFSSSVTALKYIANSQATYASLTYEETLKYSSSPAGIWFGNSFNSNNNVALQLRTSNDGTSVQALTLSSTGAATFSSSIKTGNFGSDTARTWKLGELKGGSGLVVDGSNYLSVEVNGVEYKLGLVFLG